MVLDLDIKKIGLLVTERKLDFTFLIILSLIVILTRIIFMENHLQTMIFIDSYRHLSQAIFIDLTSDFPGSFIYLLSILYPKEEAPIQSLFFLRTTVIVFSVQLVIFFYLISRKFFDPFFSVIGTLFVIFLPMFVTHSTTLHDDIFALSMALTSFYFLIRTKSLISLSLASFFLIIAVSARADMGIFIFPFLISFSLYLSKKFGLKFPVVLGIVLISFFVIALFGIQEFGTQFFYQNEYNNIIEQFFWYFTIDNLSMVIQSIFLIVENDLINGAFIFTVVSGIILVLVIHRKKLGKNFSNIKKMDEKYFVIIFLFLIFLVSIVSLTTLHIGWTVDEDGNRVPKDTLHPRYLITSRLILIFPLVYTFMIFTSKSYESIISILTLYKKDDKHES